MKRGWMAGGLAVGLWSLLAGLAACECDDNGLQQEKARIREGLSAKTGHMLFRQSFFSTFLAL